MYANTKPVMDAEAARIEAEIKTFMLMGFTLAELAVFAPDWNCPCRLCKGGTQVVVKSMVQ